MRQKRALTVRGLAHKHAATSSFPLAGGSVGSFLTTARAQAPVWILAGSARQDDTAARNGLTWPLQALT